ncbi:MAG TPA: hypothetical protein VFZ55_06455 [Nitrososphaera sp.]
MSTLMNLDILLIRSIVSPDLIINYAYTRKEEIEKHRVLLGLNKISLINILYNHQIPIHSAFFTTNEMVLILSDKDAAKAYELIRMKIG